MKMWMTEYVNEIKRQFRDVYGFVPMDDSGGAPVFLPGSIPDGEYTMIINGKVDKVRIVRDQISCCNF